MGISIDDTSDCVFVALDANQFRRYCYVEVDSVMGKIIFSYGSLAQHHLQF